MSVKPQFYLVGGAVRDTLIGLPIKDRDWLVVGATPEYLLRKKYQQVGRDFPVFLHPKTKEEYALARIESKNGIGYQGFKFDLNPTITLKQDLRRRDLTINAIAQDKNGIIFDPYKGQDDIQKRILRHVSPAFVEDPLRVLRVARFYSWFAYLGFTIAPETLSLMQSLTKSGELLNLSVERIWLETKKALTSRSPHLYFQCLHDIGALQILFPEIEVFYNVKFKQQLLSQHALSILENIANLTLNLPNTEQSLIRFAALCQNIVEIPKPHIFSSGNLTPNNLSNEEHNFQQITYKRVTNFCNRLKTPRVYLKLSVQATHCYKQLLNFNELSSKKVIQLFDYLGAWRDSTQLEHLLLITAAQLQAVNIPHYPVIKSNVFFLLKQAQTINAQDVILDGFKGEHISEELTRRRIEILEIDRDNQSYN